VNKIKIPTITSGKTKTNRSTAADSEALNQRVADFFLVDR
jgi:hypothetical protein